MQAARVPALPELTSWGGVGHWMNFYINNELAASKEF